MSTRTTPLEAARLVLPSLGCLGLLLVLALSLACSDVGSSDSSPDSGPAAADATGEAEKAEPASAKSEKKDDHAGHSHDRNERPLPAFSGRTLSGSRVDIGDFLGQRLLIYFFNPDVPPVDAYTNAVKKIEAVAADNNLRVVGVGVGTETKKLRAYREAHGLDFPIIDDTTGAIAGKLGLRSPLLLLGVDAEGFILSAIPQIQDDPSAEVYVTKLLRQSLRIEDPADAATGELVAWPEAPDFEAPRLDGGGEVDFAKLKAEGKPIVLIFFLHTCPHCHAALRSLRESLDRIPDATRPILLGVSVHGEPAAVRDSLKREGLDFFDVVRDPGNLIQQAYSATGGVPVINLIDSKGRIVHRIQGWDETRDPALSRMITARIADARVPMLLDPQGYTGSDVCGACHVVEQATWQYTSHATAYRTLVKHAKDRDAECVSCHVVGFDQKGGWNLEKRPVHLENVGCESCHGRGGPHLSPDFVVNDAYETVCRTCHNPTHSLGFNYAEFEPRISHAKIAAMSPAERKEKLAGGGAPRSLLPTAAAFVGSDACQTCHAKEYETWKSSPHGHALATLEKKGEQANDDCLRCHATAYHRPGGLPTDVPKNEVPDLAAVGCESCHGPGGDHIGASAQKVGTIVSLGDKCDSCVILKICGDCHDDANDPGFQFKVEARIDAQRHGTIESAATRSGTTAGAPPPSDLSDAELLGQAFEALEGRTAPQG